MPSQDSPFSIASGVIGILSLLLQLTILFFAALAGIYARWLWLAERIAPAQIVELTECLQSQYYETERIARSLRSVPLENGQHQELHRAFYKLFTTEIEIGRRLLKLEKLRQRVSRWHELKALRRKMEADMEVLRNEYFDARLDAISQ